MWNIRKNNIRNKKIRATTIHAIIKLNNKSNQKQWRRRINGIKGIKGTNGIRGISGIIQIRI